MWRTPLGIRTLRSFEWRLFRRGLTSLYDNIEMSDDIPVCAETGVQVFDQLPYASRIAMLALVGRAVRDAREPCPDATALTEGTVAAVYARIREDIDSEILISSERFPPDFFRVKTRLLVVKASLEAHPECNIPRRHPTSPNYDPDGLFIPKPDCEVLANWDKLLDELLSRVIGERRDFLDADQLLDADPAVSEQMRSRRKIDKGYYTAIAPEPSDRQLASIHKALCRLLGIPEPHKQEADGLF
jgi:hypothetical protein